MRGDEGGRIKGRERRESEGTIEGDKKKVKEGREGEGGWIPLG